MAHGGKHDHHHHESPKEGAPLSRIRFAFLLNFIFACIELVGGLYVNSVAILSDALHDFGDSLALGFAWALEKKSQQKSGHQFSYGYRRFSTLSAAITAGILIVGSFIIIAESLPRLWQPQQPNADGMIGLAILGVIVNGVAFFRLKSGQSLSERVLTWHFIEDLLGWVIVLIGAITMKFYHLPILDAVLAIGLALWVLWNVFRNLGETFRIFLQATPEKLSMDEVLNFIKKIPGISDCHHLHLWSMDGQRHILTAHIVLTQEVNLQQMSNLRSQIKDKLLHKFNIVESTLEFEFEGDSCADPHHQ